MTNEANVTYRFLCGADMDPTAVRGAYPRARFVARACLPQPGDVPPAGVWGILLEAPADPTDERTGPARRVVADDGRVFEVSGVAVPGGDPAAVLAAARYWELPPAYVCTLLGWSEPGDGA